MYHEIDKAKQASIIRYIALIIVLINTCLTLLGMPILPPAAADIVAAFTVLVVGLYVGFRNNYLTRRGKAQAQALAQKDLLKK